MVLAQLGDRARAGVERAELFLGLTLELIEDGTDGQAADGYDDPP